MLPLVDFEKYRYSTGLILRNDSPMGAEDSVVDISEDF